MTHSPPPVTVIEAGAQDRDYWRALWRHRELAWVLASRDLSIRYRQTAIGLAWAVLRPVLTVAVLTLVFGRWAGFARADGPPYVLVALAGLVPWQLFATIVSDASNSLVGNASLLTKVYFPRLTVPLAACASALVDAGVSLVLLVAGLLVAGVWPGVRLLLLPVAVVSAVVAALGPALWLAAQNVRYRDFRYVVPFLVQFGLYASPVAFESTLVPAAVRPFYALNPAVAPIDLCRASLLGGPLDFASLATSLAVSAALLLVGASRFRSTERAFADHL